MSSRIPATPVDGSGVSRIGGLDGLRAIAVALVVIYHLFPNALPGGFLGVDVFFVISGFLITTLLLTEHRRHGRIDLVSFWRRRARRLLPALAIVLLVCTSAASLIGGELLMNIGAQMAGAALFVANWVYIGLGSDYFAQDNPELFRNTWSLAIEEQFYLLLPLTLLFALRMRSRWTRALFYGLFGVGSAAWMSSLFLQGVPATRVYFGTDTHVFGLLLGVALACALRQPGRSVAPPVRAKGAVARQLGLLFVGLAGFAVLGALSFTLREGSLEGFTWGFQLATAAVLATVWAVTRPGAWLGRALDVQPLRWIGERSYGIYLWHWPVLLIVTELGRHAGATPWSVPALTLIITLFFAALSYRFVEQPVRRLGLRRSLSRMLRPFRLRGRQLVVGVAVLTLVVVTVPTSTIAIASAPTQSTPAGVITRGQAVLDAQQDRLDGRPSGSHRGGAGGPATPDESSIQTPAGDATDDDALSPGDGVINLFGTPKYEVPPLEPVEGWEIFAVGDSVMLASAPELTEAFPDIWIDAAVSRGLGVGVEIAQGLEAQGQLRPVLVVGLGTNGPVEKAELDALLRVAGDRRIVLVNAHADRWWVPEVNQQLAAFAETHRGVTLADWDGTIVGVPGGLAGDDIHPNPSGGAAYAAAVQSALDELLERSEQPKRARSGR